MIEERRLVPAGARTQAAAGSLEDPSVRMPRLAPASAATHRAGMLRWIGIALGVLVALAIVALVAVPPFVESRAEALLSTEGYEATIGDVDFQPFGAVATVENLRVVDRKSGQLIFDVPRARIDTAPTALLRGQLRISSVEVEGASFDLAVEPGRTEQWLDTMRRRLFELPAVFVARLHIRDANAAVTTVEIAERVALDPLEVEAHRIRTRPAKEGELPTTAWITATVPPRGVMRVRFQADPFAARSDFDLSVRANALPLQAGSQVLEKRTGLEAEDGFANVTIDARLRGGAFEGTAHTSVEEVELGGDSVAEDVVAGIAEPIADVASSADVAERTVDFEGRLQSERATLQRAITTVVDTAIGELAALPG